MRMRGNGGASDGFGRQPPRKRPLIFSNAGVADRFREKKIKEDWAAAPLEKIKASGLLGFFSLLFQNNNNHDKVFTSLEF